VTLTPEGTGTRLDYLVKAQVGGKIAQVGQRLIDGAARKMADDFFERFGAALAPQAPGPDASPSPATAAGADRPAGPAIAPWAWAIAVAAAAGLAYVALR
jgi:hypothetical protein